MPEVSLAPAAAWPSGAPTADRRRVRTRALLLAVALVVLVVEPGRVPLLEPDEGRYAEIPREMLASGDFVTPRLNGVRYFEKPPLLYWTVAASLAVFGESEAAARLPVKLASLGMVAAAFLFARRRLGLATALLSGLVVATSLLVVGLARNLLIDPLLALAVTCEALGLAAFAEHEERGEARAASRARYAVAVAAAAGVLLKGPVALILPGVPFVAWALLSGRARLVARLWAAGPLALFALLAVPWHVAAALSNPGFVEFYFWNQQVLRFLTTQHHRTGSPLYFVAVLLAGFLPWTAFFGRLAEVWPGRGRAAWQRAGWIGYLWAFSAFALLFFSVSRSKLVPYVLPIWPAVALLLAAGIDRAAARGADFRWDGRVAAFLSFGLLTAGLVAGVGQGWLERLGAGAGGVVLLAGLGLSVVAALARERAPLLPEGRLAAAWLVVLAGAVAAYPAVARAVTPWPLLERLGDPEAIVVQYHDYLRVVSFYAHRPTLVVEPGDEELLFDGQRGSGTRAGNFLDEAGFHRLMAAGGRRILVVARVGAAEALVREALGHASVVARDALGRYALVERRAESGSGLVARTATRPSRGDREAFTPLAATGGTARPAYLP